MLRRICLGAARLRGWTSCRNRVNEFNLTFGPDPSTHEYCNLGGMIGNNSCGVHSIMAGRTVDNILELDILTLRRRAHARWSHLGRRA